LQEYNLKKYAFAGIHVMSPEIFGLMADMPEKFPIITFYLSCCHKYRIKGYVAENLKLVDVGKLDSLEKAEEMVAQL
jgi:NDP-sugar pyrophosphorylase family protein